MRFRMHRLGLVVIVVLAVAAVRADASAQPQFTARTDLGLVAGFAGFGAQFNQHVYADISGPPSGLADLEAKVLAARPRFVRIFFNSTDWTYPDRMTSFVRTVQLAQRAGAQVDITWQGGSYAFTLANMPRFAGLITDLLREGGINRLLVTLLNEPNSTKITLPQYESVYRQLDRELRANAVRGRVNFIGGDLVATGQSDWFRYLAAHMGDLLDGWSIHVYWDFWDSAKIDRRLAAEVRTIFSGIPEEQRRPLYVTEFGVRGLDDPDVLTVDPGNALEGGPVAASITAAFQEAWFMVRATQLGFSGTAEWDLYSAKYDKGTQDYSAIAGSGWTLRPAYHVLRLFDATTLPGGGRTFEVVPGPDASPTQLVAGYLSPAGNVTLLGLDTRGGAVGATSDGTRLDYSFAGLPPRTRFRLLIWNGRGDGTNVDVGFMDTDDAGRIAFRVPVNAVFALTTTPLADF